MNAIHKFKLMLDNMTDTNIDCSDIIKECFMMKNLKQNIRGINTLLIRYYIIKNDIDNIKNILYGEHVLPLMKRDYITILEYFLNDKINNHDEDIKYIYSNINELETKDVDLLIKNNWTDVLKKFDGYMVISSLESNTDDTSRLKKYDFDVSILRDKYSERIKNKEEIEQLYLNTDVLIDGANMSHLTGKFDFSILPKLIKKCLKMNLRPKIVLHERHKITDESLIPYLIRTPMLRNDDDYMIYGMLSHKIMVLSNDFFRDHVKNMDGYTKCYINSMRMRLKNNIIVIPKYSICIQVIENDIYVPCVKGFFKISV